jgi:hypothetical protein
MVVGVLAGGLVEAVDAEAAVVAELAVADVELPPADVELVTDDAVATRSAPLSSPEQPAASAAPSAAATPTAADRPRGERLGGAPARRHGNIRTAWRTSAAAVRSIPSARPGEARRGRRPAGAAGNRSRPGFVGSRMSVGARGLLDWSR